MNSLVLRTAARFLLPLLLVFSVVLLLQGHNEPGGGFVGGLVSASAFTLYAVAFGRDAALRAVGINLQVLAGLGVTIAILSGVPALVLSEPFLTGHWATVPIPGIGDVKIGTPLLFDIGVYCTVWGVALIMVLNLAEE
ncbi:MAG: Na+/H+ antiporter subunit B [Phycisphaeraceae bacterium]|nr:Na+/H+ antiporter subunit B [Phycisphaeraceae bacterium]